MAEWFKAVDCKSIEYSHRRFKSYFLLKSKVFFTRNIAQSVARLFWEQEVMCSNHIISILLTHNFFLNICPKYCVKYTSFFYTRAPLKFLTEMVSKFYY